MHSGEAITKEIAEKIVAEGFEEARSSRADYAKITKIRIVNDFLIGWFDIDWKKLLRPDEVDK